VPNADELCMCSSDSPQLHLLVKQAQDCGRECTTNSKSSVVDWWFQISSTSSNMGDDASGADSLPGDLSYEQAQIHPNSCIA
jgi:hypothetical protein